MKYDCGFDFEHEMHALSLLSQRKEMHQITCHQFHFPCSFESLLLKLVELTRRGGDLLSYSNLGNVFFKAINITRTKSLLALNNHYLMNLIYMDIYLYSHHVN